VAADVLRERYEQMGVSVAAIEDVDHVSDGRPMHEVIGGGARYDWIYSAHSIEHIPDFVGFFRSAEALLKPGGMLVMVIPDKRYMFDVYQMPSTTGDVIQAHLEKRSRHAAAKVFDFTASFARLNGETEIWTVYEQGPINLAGAVQSAHENTLAAIESRAYTDVHGWYFTPSSLRLIMHDLNEIGLVGLREANIVENGSCEFFVVFSREAPGCGLDRQELIRQVIRDQTISGLQILAAHNHGSDLWRTLQLATS
jgi:SAM-dependent methyltransferase